MSANRLQYCFDPLCGWCYAAAPVVQALAKAFPSELEMLPSGLFAGEGARVMSPEWARHVWDNDQRIEEMTGQLFSDAYRHIILGAHGRPFDSMAMTRALTAVRSYDAALEPRVLNCLQQARYVDGRDTSEPEVVAGVVATCLQQAGWHVEADELAERLRRDEELAWDAQARIAASQQRMQDMSVAGVPALFAQVGDLFTVVQGGALYQNPAGLVQALQQWFDSASERAEAQPAGDVTEGE